MLLQFASDLHLEFPENKAYLKVKPLPAVGDILILAGDIVPFKYMAKHAEFFSFLADNFQQTYWVPGNHEYYYGDVSERSGAFTEAIRSNVTLLNNSSVTIGNVQLVFSTLWSRILLNPMSIQFGMSDFRVINYLGESIQVAKYNALHEECFSFISAALSAKKSGQKYVVITHHVPTRQNYPLEYTGSTLTEGFSTDLDKFIEEKAPDYWLYGHHHRNVADFKIGETCMSTNQLGYVHFGEHLLFNPEKVLIF